MSRECLPNISFLTAAPALSPPCENVATERLLVGQSLCFCWHNSAIETLQNKSLLPLSGRMQKLCAWIQTWNFIKLFRGNFQYENLEAELKKFLCVFEIKKQKMSSWWSCDYSGRKRVCSCSVLLTELSAYCNNLHQANQSVNLSFIQRSHRRDCRQTVQNKILICKTIKEKYSTLNSMAFKVFLASHLLLRRPVERDPSL